VNVASMRKDPKIEMLRRVPALAAYSDAQLGDLAALVDELSIESGHVLTREGRAGREAFLIVEGEATVTIAGELVAKVGSGQFVGEMSLLEHQPCTATVTAVTPMRVLVMDPRSFGTMLSDASMATRMARSLATRLREQESPATAG
jgi:CRP/FNR family cyclic AMP-dependent transcriptional regulator